MAKRRTIAALALMAASCLASGCGRGRQRPELEAGPLTTMTLLSDRQDTRFAVRSPGGGWQAAGTGTTVAVQVYANLPCEVLAEAPGWPPRTASLREPMREVRFVFLGVESDEWPRQIVEAEVRVLAPAEKTVETVAAASATVVGWTRFRTCLAQVAEDLARQPALRGKRLAVLEFREGPGAKGLGSTARAMFLAELAATRQDIRPIEPNQLAAILEAAGLRESDLAADPRCIERLGGMDAVAVGEVRCRTE